MAPLHDLQLMIQSRYPLIAIGTLEEARLGKALDAIAGDLSVRFFVWTLTTGLRRFGNLLAQELGATKPLSVTRREDIDRLRAWAADRTVSAS